jgi:hypothetical protein
MADPIIIPNVTDVIIHPDSVNEVIYPIFGETGPQGPQGPVGPSGAPGYYGAFSDYTQQTALANTATIMRFGTVDGALGFSVVSGSQLTAAYTGIYNFQWSGQFECSSPQDQDVDVWIRINGVDVVGSTGSVSIPSTHGGVNGHLITGWNFIISLTAGDYVQLMWATPVTNVFINTYAAGVSPTHPSTASLIATFHPVLNNVQGPQGPTGASGVFIGPTAPADTSLLWVDTS